jgi:hypothetical protein
MHAHITETLPENIVPRFIARETKRHGGGTFCNHGATPTTGYAVSLAGYETKHKVYDEAFFIELDLILSMSETQDNVFVGTWVNPDDGLIYLDATVVVHDIDEAMALGYENSQLAIFDLYTHETISL